MTAGFDGLSIDRLAYADRGSAVESEVSSQLGGAAPLVSPNGRLSFFELRT